jgi:hypothetical protein
MALPAQELQAVQIKLKSVTNEGHFPLEPRPARRSQAGEARKAIRAQECEARQAKRVMAKQRGRQLGRSGEARPFR